MRRFTLSAALTADEHAQAVRLLGAENLVDSGGIRINRERLRTLAKYGLSRESRQRW